MSGLYSLRVALVDTTNRPEERAWFCWLPPTWLRDYGVSWLGSDIISGVTWAAYAIPVSLAYASLAGLPPQVGIYGYLLGGLGYALFGSSRQLAIGPTSAISLMMAATMETMAGGRRAALRGDRKSCSLRGGSPFPVRLAVALERSCEARQRPHSWRFQSWRWVDDRDDPASEPVGRAGWGT